MSLSPLLRWISSSCPVVSILAIGLLDLDVLLGEVLVDFRGVELADDVALLDLGPLGNQADDLDLLGVDLADAVDGDAAFEVAAFGDGDSQGGLAHFGEQRPARRSKIPARG